jgi:hypothetical protein
MDGLLYLGAFLALLFLFELTLRLLAQLQPPPRNVWLVTKRMSGLSDSVYVLGKYFSWARHWGLLISPYTYFEMLEIQRCKRFQTLGTLHEAGPDLYSQLVNTQEILWNGADLDDIIYLGGMRLTDLVIFQEGIDQKYMQYLP